VDGTGVNSAGVRSVARIVARDDARGSTALPVLESDGPLALRRTRASGTEARVMLVGAMSGPLGGDHFTVRARVEEGARLSVGSAAATIALPGQTKGEARYDVRLDVADEAELHWLPEQLISAQAAICTSRPASSSPPRPGSCCARSRCSGGWVRTPGG
jgi:urease accessory protein